MKVMDTRDIPDRPAQGGERKGGRPAAGTDPAKRRQILEGAGRVFSNLGFDATSMSDVAREAQVSKATLYVYFEDKEHLFTAICAEKRDRNIGELIAMFDPARPLENVLTEFATEMLTRVSEPYVIAAHRIVIGVAERMPDIGREFFDAGPKRVGEALARLLDHHVSKGRLKIDDTYFAAAQFAELAQTLIFRPRLYAVVTEQPSREEIAKVVNSAVAMFLSAYATKPAAA